MFRAILRLTKKSDQNPESESGQEVEFVDTLSLELIISTVVGLTSILLISYLLFELKSGLIFIIMFVPLRLFTGGYHAKTYGKCFVISNCAYLTILVLKYIMWDNIPSGIWIGLLVIASCYIAANAPVIYQAQSISEYKQMRCKRIAKYILITEIVAMVYQ